MSLREILAPQVPMVIGLNREEPVLCPICGDIYLHHAGIVVRSRTAEDAHGVEVTVIKGAVHVETRAPAFTGRRDDFRIEFWCEGCAMSFALAIKQHKGCTYAEFSVLGPAREMEDGES